MTISLQIIIFSTVVGALTQSLKWLVKRLSKDILFPKWVHLIGEVYIQRIAPYIISILLWLISSDIFDNISESIGFPTTWNFIIALFCASISSFVYTTVKDWIRSKDALNV